MSNNPAKCEILINWTILAYNPGRHKWREYYWKHRACANSFNSLENKEKLSFICFDVCEFYPSINEKLLSKALDFASTYRPISRHERGIILHAKRSLLFSNYSTWKKKSSNDFFWCHRGFFWWRVNVQIDRLLPSIPSHRQVWPKHQSLSPRWSSGF